MARKSSGASFTCRNCGKVVPSTPSIASKKIFCSRKCQKIYCYVMVNCKNCGEGFSTHRSTNQVFCSFECSRIFLKGANHFRWIADRARICFFCGIVFEANTTSERSKKYCSYECCVADRKENGFPAKVFDVGDSTVWSDGYVYIKTESGWVAEHKLVAEEKIGRELLSSEIVHHRNGNTTDNHEDNLQVVTRKEHMAIHARAELIGLQIMAADNYEFNSIGLGC
jgi:HNH endonuclease